jgi:hypothetical protein
MNGYPVCRAPEVRKCEIIGASIAAPMSAPIHAIAASLDRPIPFDRILDAYATFGHAAQTKALEVARSSNVCVVFDDHHAGHG